MSEQIVNTLSRQRKTGKAQLFNVRRLSLEQRKGEFDALCTSLAVFSKKTGAGNKMKVVPQISPMSDLLAKLSKCINAVACTMAMQDVPFNFRKQMCLLWPWLCQCDRMLTNILRTLNDRVSMLWRNHSPAMECASLLHQDVSHVGSLLNKFLSSFKPRKATMCETQIRQSMSSTSPSGGHYIVDSQLWPLGRQIVARVKFHFNTTIPSFLQRVEAYVQSNINERIGLMCKTDLLDTTFYKNKKACTSIGELVVNGILSPYFDVIIAYSKSPSIERLVTTCANSCLDQLLHYIVSNRFQFDQPGVLRLFTELNYILSCVVKLKPRAGVAPYAVLISDVTPWYKANAILSVLSASTSGTKFTASNSTRCLSTAEQEKWLQLGDRPPCNCIFFKVKLPKRQSNKPGKAQTVSISPSLDVQHL